jgi:hypothetical protein
MRKTTHWGATPEEWELFSKTLGLTGALLPIVSNPNATISPGSDITVLGKTPSLYNSKGQVYGLPWRTHTSKDSDIAGWSHIPDYGMGINCETIRAADIDIEDGYTVERILSIFLEVLKYDLPIRHREGTNRRLLPYRLKGTYPKRTLTFGNNLGIVEFLGDGQQFMACGTHQGGKRYQWWWPGEPSIPEITQDQFEEIYDTIRSRFDAKDSRSKSYKTEKIKNVHSSDPILNELYAKGVVLSERSDGGVNIICPFADSHTSKSGDTATSYFPPNTGGFKTGSIKCLHAHCEERHTNDYLPQV